MFAFNNSFSSFSQDWEIHGYTGMVTFEDVGHYENEYSGGSGSNYNATPGCPTTVRPKGWSGQWFHSHEDDLGTDSSGGYYPYSCDCDEYLPPYCIRPVPYILVFIILMVLSRVSLVIFEL
jgi:hypothetical protein